MMLRRVLVLCPSVPIARDDLTVCMRRSRTACLSTLTPGAGATLCAPDLQQTVIDAIYTLREQGQRTPLSAARAMMGSHVFAQDPRTVAFNEWATSSTCPLMAGHLRLWPLHCGEWTRSQAELLDSCADDSPGRCPVAADPLAVGVTQVLVACGLYLDQIAVVSIDNLEVCEYTAPTLSSYAIERSELAETALMLLQTRSWAVSCISITFLLSTRSWLRQSFVPRTAPPHSDRA